MINPETEHALNIIHERILSRYDNNDSIMVNKPRIRRQPSTTNKKLNELLKLAEQNTKEHRELVQAMKEYIETMQQIVKEMK